MTLSQMLETHLAQRCIVCVPVSSGSPLPVRTLLVVSLHVEGRRSMLWGFRGDCRVGSACGLRLFCPAELKQSEAKLERVGC